MKLRAFILAGAAMLLTASLSAAPYSATGPGTSTVGSGGDYATLGDAVAAITAAGTRDNTQWVLEIVSDTNEPTNISLMCTIDPGGSILIRPAPATQPTVTFQTTTDNAGPSGHFIIGGTTATGWVLGSTNGVIIDGSNNGTDTRDLTFQNTVAVGHTFASIIAIVGDTDGTIIRNCRILNRFTNTGGSLNGLSIRPRNQGGVDYIPDNTQVINNEIQVLTNQGHGIFISNSGTLTAGQAPSGTVIRGNDITARIRPIFLNPAYGWTIEDNNLTTTGIAGFDTFGIFQNNTNAPPPYTSIARNNRIHVFNPSAAAATQGTSGIFLGTSGAGLDRVLEVYNNTIILENTGARNAGVNVTIRGIASTSGVTTRIYHNSIFIPQNPAAAGAPTGVAAYGIGGYVATGYSSTIRNNIIAVEEGNVPAISQNVLPSGAAGTGFSSDHNNIHVANGALTGRIVGDTYATLALWQGQGHDLNGDDMDATAVWVSSTDLHFDGDPGTAWKFGELVAGIPGLETDVDGEERDVIVPYVGADSPVVPDRTLTIASAYGSPIPPVGVYTVTSNTLINAGVNSPVSLGAGSRAVSTGFAGTGDAGSGGDTVTSFTLVDNSTLTWNWQVQHELTTNVTPLAGGTVVPAGTTWQDENDVVQVEAFPNAGYSFIAWSGDLAGATNPDNVTMDAPKTVTAGFSAFAVIGEHPNLGEWDPPSAPILNDSGVNGDMVAGDSVYTLSADIHTTPTEWKILLDKSQGWAGGDLGRQADGGNMPDAATTGTILYFYDLRDLTLDGWMPATEGLGSTALSNIPWVAVGTFQGWDPDSTETVMNDDGVDGDETANDGIFTYQFVTEAAFNDSDWKVVSNLDTGWNGEYKFGTNGMSRDPGDSANATFTAGEGATVTFEYDAWRGHIRVTVEEPPPTAVEEWLFLD